MTKRIAHTPGPWYAEGHEIKSDDYGGIGLTYNEPAENKPLMRESRGNAHLMAAAPEMEAALLKIRNWCQAAESMDARLGRNTQRRILSLAVRMVGDEAA